MTLEEILARQGEIGVELEALNSEEMDEDGEARFAELSTEFDTLDEQRVTIVARNEKLEEVRVAATDPRNVITNADALPVPGMKTDPYDLSDVRAFGDPASELRSRALSAVDKEDSLTGHGDRVHDLLNRYDDDEGTIAKIVLGTGSDAYRRAFGKYLRNPENVWATLTPEESSAVSRAMSLTDGAGGFAVPFPIDPTLIDLGDGSVNPYRQIARVVPITTDSWQGVASTAMTASWDAEAAEVSDDTTTFTQPSIPVYKGAAFVAGSLEIAGDYPGLESDLAMLFNQAKDDLEATAFATGTGSAQPTGIVTALTGGASEVPSATADTFAIADVYATEGALPSKYSGRASWVANKLIYNLVRQFDTAGGAGLWERIGAGRPAELLGSSAYESSAMDGAITAAAENYVLVYGDFSRFVIADRVGASLEFIPHLFHTTSNRPSGQRGWYFNWRVGSDSVDDGAFSMLNVT